MGKEVSIKVKNVDEDKRDMLYKKLTEKHKDIYKRLAK